MNPPPPTMPPPSRRPAPPVRRFVIVDAAHAERAFPGPDLDRERLAIREEIERTGGAVLVLAHGSWVDRVLPLHNGAEIGAALGSLTGAVAFQIERLPTEPPPASLPSPLPRETSIAEAEVEIARLRRVEDAARALLATMPRCGKHEDRPATMERIGGLPIAVYCDECAERGVVRDLRSSREAAAVRALSALLAGAAERAA